MKKIIVTLTIFLFISAFNLYAETIEVCSSCKNTSIKEAIAIAKDYDTLLIKKGTYKEYNIIIDKPLVIIGENYPVIDGEFKGEIITIVSDNVTIDGLFIINKERNVAF